MIIFISQMRKSRFREAKLSKVTQPINCKAGICTDSLPVNYSHSLCHLVSATFISPYPNQEYLSSTLAALRSNQIITLKVRRFGKISSPSLLIGFLDRA
jgi:hypothetical protein